MGYFSNEIGYGVPVADTELEEGRESKYKAKSQKETKNRHKS